MCIPRRYISASPMPPNHAVHAAVFTIGKTIRAPRFNPPEDLRKAEAIIEKHLGRFVKAYGVALGKD